MADKKFRLVTRSDFDGLVCAVLLKDMDIIDEIKFVHPKDMQDGLVEITDNDITTNLPYVEGVHLAFDHHLSETIRVGKKDNHIIEASAPSAARVVYNYYGGKERFPKIGDDIMEAVDRGDSANFTLEQVLKPKGWDLMNFLMDARTGLGRFRDFRISNYQLMMKLIDLCKDHSIDDIMQDEDVKERAELYFEQQRLFEDQIKRCAKVYGNLVVLDLRNEDTIYAGNRFIIYALYPEQNISIHVMWGLKKQNTVFATGKSIFNKTSKTNIGELMLSYGGGGHMNAGTCQVDNDFAEQKLAEIVRKINADG
ncbi:exopolyphosphatase [Seleniivibrio woodruffii]|uniref:NanoRNase/pAp phosphatase (C-di-AMP/oligoRNAs hydrolase) n=1 Tax=Seleniivibrio woodruffii TaxID=1078050 RepID=A0A4R1K9D3_9BACT|nr:exopolyphosphatase [Seleniivibrio woodruffii]TCK60996.1 nanoRNase/pAp phosphatase (c-di-AMP/oligoRNAs hydrolase) [Seleniivibrio woodruffii]TVZ36626.1 nanoRNase/pAp phosphatase (c-di-AMP/oligoRNAs hydrolase) [Seleniivibrio woodruffii]